MFEVVELTVALGGLVFLLLPDRKPKLPDLRPPFHLQAPFAKKNQLRRR